MQKQFTGYWSGQSRAQRITLIALLAAALVVVTSLIVWSNTPTYAVAYSGLSEADAGQIVQKMDESNIPYQIKDTGTILVPTDQVYSARLTMAREGLPQTSTVGFELFSGNTFGMTEFTQRVNYQRALEGELERTIASLASVEEVQVHVVTPEKTLLAGDQAPTTASVTIRQRSGRALDAAQVRAMIHLVSSSVEGLKPDNVVIVDTEGTLLSGGTNSESSEAISLTDRQRSAEAAAGAEVKQRVQKMLDEVLGPGKSVVQASVSMNWNEREVTSNAFNPTPAAVRSSQLINESYSTDGNLVGGVPGAGSNLPTPVATVAAGSGNINYQRSESTQNYELSQVQSHEVFVPGQVERVTVSVMVDGISDAGQLATIRTAASAAAGIDETRGDLIVVDSLPFDRTAAEKQAAIDDESQKVDLYSRVAVIGLAVLLLVALLVFFQRLLYNLRLSTQAAWQPVLMPARQMALAANSGKTGGAKLPAGTQQPARNILPVGKTAEERPVEEESEAEGVKVDLSLRQKRAKNSENEQRLQMLSRLAEENPATVAEIIQLWLNEDDHKNG